MILSRVSTIPHSNQFLIILQLSNKKKKKNQAHIIQIHKQKKSGHPAPSNNYYVMNQMTQVHIPSLTTHTESIGITEFIKHQPLVKTSMGLSLKINKK